MRIPCLLLAAWLVLGTLAHADDQLVQRFDGHDSLTTADFTVPDGWEIRWHSDQVLSVGVIRRDNTVVAGTTGRNIGSLYLPQGGTFRIRVKGEDPIRWDVAVYALDKDAQQDNTASDYYSPTEGPAFKPIADVPAAKPPPVAPVVVPPATPPPPPPLPTQLNADQLRCLVRIKGDGQQGTGFFIKLGGEKVIATAQQIIANNPHWKVFASNGNEVQVTKIDGATDRDLVTLSVKDFGYPSFTPAGGLHPGDQMLTAAADGTTFPSAPVTAIGQQRIEINGLRAPPGCPVVQAQTGQVVGVVSAGPQVSTADNFAGQSFDRRDALAVRSMATFAMRGDNVPGREPLDALRLQTQVQFLDAFHEHSRMLDAYLNGFGTPSDRRIWQGDEALKTANANCMQRIAGGDPSERDDALHALLFELGLAADVNFAQAQLPSNFYRFTGLRAKDETAYRQALKNELESFNNNISGLDTALKRNN